MNKALAWICLLLVACSGEEQPQAPTAAESERLDEAEAMLNDLAKEERAAADATAPPTTD